MTQTKNQVAVPSNKFELRESMSGLETKAVLRNKVMQ